jgi:H2-forming N5,N10-methylenetetrahydromethanopterin dehydrogenase-like enzyme
MGRCQRRSSRCILVRRISVEATGKKQVILAGIVTEVCKSCYRPRIPVKRSADLPLGTAFLALSLREAGYSVWANSDASGTFTPILAEDANSRMEQAGVHLVSQSFSNSVVAET